MLLLASSLVTYSASGPAPRVDASRSAVRATLSAEPQAAAPGVSAAQQALPEQVAALLIEYLKPENLLEQRSVKLRSPADLDAAFAEAGCSLPLAEAEEALDAEKLLNACKLTLEYSVQTGSPLFFNQLYGRADTASIVGEWIAAAVNTNSHTFEVAPVFTLMEKYVLDRFASAVGPGFAAESDGLFVPGSSIGNLYGLILARHRVAPEIHTKGAAAAPRLVAFVSSQAHYSYLKSVRLLGIGSDNLVSVATDPTTGQMDPAALRAAIRTARADGATPFFVGATAATTVIGAFDPLRELRAVCDEEAGGEAAAEQQQRLWLHVDGAWGGAALLSPTHAHHLDGADAADSLACSLHKMLGATLQCSVFVTRHRGALLAANAANAAYLFQPDKLYTELDVGDKTIQCGRKADAFKMWLMWKSLGDAGLAARVDHAFALAAHATRVIDASDGALVLAYPPSCTNVCFWYVPERLRGAFPRGAAAMPPAADGALTPAHPIHAVAPRIKAALQKEGGALIGFQSVNGLPNFFRWVFASADTVTPAHVEAILARIAELGEELDEP